MEYNENEITGPGDKNCVQSHYRLPELKEWDIFTVYKLSCICSMAKWLSVLNFQEQKLVILIMIQSINGICIVISNNALTKVL
jgi:hypothetical protein